MQEPYEAMYQPMIGDGLVHQKKGVIMAKKRVL